jgi:hypothetical protein
LAISLVLVGCGAEDRGGSPATPSPDAECLAPARLVGEICIPPGVQDDGCAAGTVARQDGTCLPAGIVEGGCAEGFTHDGAAGCVAILPEQACPAGQMAVPGDATCHPVMDCGEGTWGDIPLDATTVFVDASYTGGASTGTQAEPFVTVSDAIGAAVDGATIAVAAGTYSEDLLVTKPVMLRGVCPERVALVGTGASLATLELRGGASGSEVSGVAITGDDLTGVFVTGAQDVLLSNVWVHDGSGQGVTIQDNQGSVSMTLRDSLIELTHGLGVFITGSVVEDNHQLGVFVQGSTAEMEGVVVRGAFQKEGDGGRGLNIQAHPTSGAPSTVTVRGALLEGNHELAVHVQDSALTLEGVVIRDTHPTPDLQYGGRGLNIQSQSQVDVVGTVIERSHAVGVFVSGSTLSASGLVVGDTQPSALASGRGLGLQHDTTTGTASTAVVTGSVIERNDDLGVYVGGSLATLSGVIVGETAQTQSEGLFGDGVLVISIHQPGQAAWRADPPRSSAPQPTRTREIAKSVPMGQWSGLVSIPIGVSIFRVKASRIQQLRTASTATRPSWISWDPRPTRWPDASRWWRNRGGRG